MRRILSAVLAVGAVVSLTFWWGGGFDRLAAWAADHQRSFQSSIAAALRAVRAGHPGAVIALLSACFAYGFFHAVGPGHGKLLIGGYGVGRHVPLGRLTLISLAASLGQALTAVALVYAGVSVLNLTRDSMIGVTERIMAPVSFAAIAMIGVWLMWRGLRRMRQRNILHPHGETVHCDICGHAHGPSLDDVATITNLREASAVIAGIALRPCTGALFVLIITWQMGIAAIGIWGAFAMALGTASVTIAVGAAAVGLRSGMLGAIAGGARAGQFMAGIEIAAGLAVAILAGGLLLRAI